MRPPPVRSAPAAGMHAPRGRSGATMAASSCPLRAAPGRRTAHHVPQGRALRPLPRARPRRLPRSQPGRGDTGLDRPPPRKLNEESSTMTTENNKRRRRRALGAVRQLPSRRWQARYRDKRGRLVAAPHTFPTKTDATRYLARGRGRPAPRLLPRPQARRDTVRWVGRAVAEGRDPAADHTRPLRLPAPPLHQADIRRNRTERHRRRARGRVARPAPRAAEYQRG